MHFTNAFVGKTTEPPQKELATALGPAFPTWNEFLHWFSEEHGVTVQEWTTYSPKYGWTMRLKFKKRTIVYLGPGAACFQVAFILGERAVAAARSGNLPETVLNALAQSPRYPEGTGLRLLVSKPRDMPPLRKLVLIKLAN